MGRFDRRHGGPGYMYHGRRFDRFYGPRYHWPHGYRYERFRIGFTLPLVFLNEDNYIYDYDYYSLDAPPPGFVWMRYGPDLLLVDVESGDIAQIVYGAFDEEG